MRRIGTTDIKVKERKRERKKENDVAGSLMRFTRGSSFCEPHDVHSEGKCQEIYIKLNRDGVREEREMEKERMLKAFLVAYPGRPNETSVDARARNR